jgi:hypothetical protein
MLGGLFISHPVQPDLQLIFVGYTNEPMESVSDGYTMWLRKAVVAITNSGSVTIRLVPLWQAYSKAQLSTGIAQTYVIPQTSWIEAGTSTTGITYPGREPRWRANIAYTRIGWTERLAGKVQFMTNGISQKLVNRLIPATKLYWARSPWITNASRYHITAPPREIPIELLPKPKP